MHFNWLHFTDLHWGMGRQDWVWQNVRERVLEDLEHLHRICGPWHLILFTGDLVYSGAGEQYQKLDRVLTELIDWIAERQPDRRPVLLTVPGNHDLDRDRAEYEPRVTLAGWSTNPAIQDLFWESPESAVRKTVTAVFSEYTTWWTGFMQKQRGKNGLVEIRKGLLPGDFSATIENEHGCRLGVLGLNTAFLQLTGGDYHEQLALHTSQFQAACDKDGPKWAKAHHACLLMTHHPPDWLDEASRQDHLDGEIIDHGRFAAHLCGHMHKSHSQYTAVDGNRAKLLLQGRSLFGLDTYHKPDGKKLERLHGFAAGRIVVGGDQAGTLVLWPRGGKRTRAEINIGPDPDINFPKGTEAMEPFRFDLPMPCTGGGSGVLLPDSNPAPGGPGSSPDDSARADPLAAAIERELAGAHSEPLRRVLAEAVNAGPHARVTDWLCALKPARAAVEVTRAAERCLRESLPGPEKAGLDRVARRIFGLLLTDLTCACRPEAPFGTLVRVGSAVGAEVIWAYWAGKPIPAEYKVVEGRTGAGEPRRRLVGLCDILDGKGLAEEGFEAWERDALAAKQAYWNKLVPGTDRYPEHPPTRFGPREHEVLLKYLNLQKDIDGRFPYYLAVDRSDEHSPLNDSQVLEDLRRNAHLPIVLIEETRERLFKCDESELEALVLKCLDQMDKACR